MDEIQTLLNRGVDKIYPSKEELEKLLRSGKKLTIYQGFDPTGDKLHIGHMVGLMKLADWQKLGHHVIFLIGDFTGMIGDPSGKSSTRKMLSHEEVIRNAKSYKDQAGKILNFEGENAAEVKYNGDWLQKMSAIEFLRIAGLLSYQQVVERDLFQERAKNGQDLFMNEFLYPVMQAYDSVAMNVDVEVGGTDQMFNMLMGRKLMRHMLQKDKFVMTTPILTDSSGNKIGKTEGNAIALDDHPDDLYSKIMALPDDIIVKGFEYLTRIPYQTIDLIKNSLQGGDNPINHKKNLAHEIVRQLSSQEKADTAQQKFESVIQNKQTPTEIEEIPLTISVSEKISVADALVALDLVESKSEAKRLITQGGVTIYNEVISDPNKLFEGKDQGIIKIGKRKIVKLLKP
ncbi:MAG: tyrosine--tRNA ligase [Candidatus Levybacteria bacterium]|nr:tyrosine--tRNA ligase [Candidatus Levybacteria bacterium]